MLSLITKIKLEQMTYETIFATEGRTMEGRCNSRQRATSGLVGESRAGENKGIEEELAGRDADTREMGTNAAKCQAGRLQIEGECGRVEVMPRGIGHQFRFPILPAPKQWYL
jgi:hypothetical protein